MVADGADAGAAGRRRPADSHDEQPGERASPATAPDHILTMTRHRGAGRLGRLSPARARARRGASRRAARRVRVGRAADRQQLAGDASRSKGSPRREAERPDRAAAALGHARLLRAARACRSSKAATSAPTDDRKAPSVAVVNQALADRYFPHGNADRQEALAGRTASSPPTEIVGVVGERPHRRPDAGGRRRRSICRSGRRSAFSKHLVVRTAADPRAVIGRGPARAARGRSDRRRRERQDAPTSITADRSDPAHRRAHRSRRAQVQLPQHRRLSRGASGGARAGRDRRRQGERLRARRRRRWRARSRTPAPICSPAPTSRKGAALRAAGVRAEILVFGALSVSDLDGLFDCRLTPTISTPGAARAVQAAAAQLQAAARAIT